MSTLSTVLVIILAIFIVGTIVLYFVGKKLEKTQAEADEKMEANSQLVTMLVIDKKRMRIKDAGFPANVVASVPKYLKGSKVDVVKVKIGPKIMPMMCDPKVFPLIPVKKEIKAKISGIYITNVKGLRGTLEMPAGKKRFLDRFLKK